MEDLQWAQDTNATVPVQLTDRIISALSTIVNQMAKVPTQYEIRLSHNGRRYMTRISQMSNRYYARGNVCLRQVFHFR